MSETLIAVLHGVRRRLRLRRALDAAVLGGTVALAMAAGLAALTLGRPADVVGAATWAALAGWQRLGLLLAAAVLGGILGALLAIARRPAGELAAAATAVDRWLDRSGARGDRARVALALGDSPSPFARAAVADAVERAAGVPVREAAPLRRPRRLGALAVAGACGLVAALAPGMAPTAAMGRRARAVVATGDSGRALAEVEQIGREARARGDDELAALADELGRWLASRQRDAPAAAEELAALAARARRAAEDGAQAAEVLARVAAVLAGTDATRALGQAYASMDPAAIAREARAAGAAGSADALAGALARAAAAAARPDEAEPRRLSGLEPEPTPAPGRPGAANPAAAGGAPATPERRLRRLERDLREAADACAADPRRCGPELDARADNLAAPARDAAGVEGRERLARTTEELRGGGGEARPGERSGSSSGRPAQARSGGPGRTGRTMMPGAAPSAAGGPGQATAEGNAQGEAAAGSAAQGEAAAARSDEAAAAAARQAFEQAARGDGAGAPGAEGPDGAGSAGTGAGSGNGDATGAGQTPGAPAGPRVELSIPEGAGPTRAEAIRTGAGRGFAQPGYAPVFRDYQAAVEDGLERTDVPAERRQLVRRYFELIRPR